MQLRHLVFHRPPMTAQAVAPPDVAPQRPPLQLRGLWDPSQLPAAGPARYTTHPVHDLPATPAIASERPAPIVSPLAGQTPDSPPVNAQDWYGKTEAALLAVTTAIAQHRPWNLTMFPALAAELVAILKRQDDLLVHAFAQQHGAPLVSNMVHVGIFAVRMGMGLKYTDEDLMKLGLVALVHDLGMATLPPDLLATPGRWTAEQMARLHEHPHQTAELVRQGLPAAPWVADIVIQEHERISGTGYPQGLTGTHVHEIAALIGVADVLDALLRARGPRSGLIPYEAMRLLLVRERQHFPTRILKVLLSTFSLFPIGTWARLTSGEIGEVIAVNARFPLRPVLRILTNAQEVVQPQTKILDLSTHPLSHVKEIVEWDTMQTLKQGPAASLFHTPMPKENP